MEPPESKWSTNPSRTTVIVSKPRCGCAGKPGTITNGHVMTIDNGSSGSGTIAAGNSLTAQFVSEITVFD